MKSLILPVALLVGVAGCNKDGGGTANENQTNAGEPTAANAEEPAQPRRVPPPQKEPPPPSVEAPPPEAQKTESGLAFLVLEEGQGGERPGPNDIVEVEWTGWRATSGEMFYTTKRRGQPVPMALAQVADGWREGLQLMSVGEKRRFWLPPELAYPAGAEAAKRDPMTIEVKLHGIKKAPMPPENLDKAPANAKKTGSGIGYVVVQPGKGEPLAEWDSVEMHHSVWDQSGKMFDSTVLRGKPQPLAIAKQAPPWMKEALLTMREGGTSRFWIPEAARGPKMPNAPQGTVVWEVEVVSVTRGSPPPAAPKDVAAPPKDAQKTAEGTYYKFLKKGGGKGSPTVQSTIKIHYTGWTTDGKMFDSSVERGQPIEFPLNQLIAGWQHVLPLMSPGDQARLWIPEEHAYGGRPGKPAGMLVFDIELFEFK